MLRIKQLKIKGCRKIKDILGLAIEPDGLIICDEKSRNEESVIQIIWNLLAGRGEAVQDLLDEDNPDYDPSNIELVLTDNGTDYTIGLNNDPLAADDSTNRFTESLKRGNFAINDIAVENFAKFNPDMRYMAFSDALNMIAYTDFEMMLEIITAPIVRELSEKDKSIKKIKNHLKRFLAIKDPANDFAYLSEINRRLANAQVSEISSFSQLKDRAVEIDKIIAEWTRSDEYANISSLKPAIANLITEDKLWGLWDNYSNVWEKLNRLELETKGLFFEDVLSKGLKWIEDDHLEKCPLCENTIDAAALKANLLKRVENNSAVITLRRDFADAAGILYETIMAYVENLININNRCENLNIANPLLEITKKLEHQCSVITQSAPSVYIPVLGDITREQIASAKSALKIKVDAEAARVMDNERLSVLDETKQLLEKVESFTRELAELQEEKNSLEAKRDSQRRINNFAAKAKKTAIEKLIMAVSDKADCYFRDIYDPEKDKKSKNGSVFNAKTGIVLDSIGSDPDTAALPDYYNENSLSTLGLCIFLAVKKLLYGSSHKIPLLFIDKALDVTDTTKRERIAELIFSEFNSHQIIISTSDIEWVKCLNEVKNKTGKKISLKFDSLALYSKYRQAL